MKLTKFVVFTILVYVLALAGLLWLIACDNSTVTGPSDPPPTDTTTTAPPEPEGPPRVDADFSWDTYQGFTAFAAGNPWQTEQDVRGLFAEAMAHGWNTARKCAETEFWTGNHAYPQMPRDIPRLKWYLDIVATIPGAQVLLIGDCTLKGPVPEPEKREWARRVAWLAAQYKNVAIETHNEWKNCDGRGWGPHCPTEEDVRAHVQIYRQAGIQNVTADDSICANPGSYRYGLAGTGAWPADFHPCRGFRGTPVWDPSIGFLRELANANGTYVLSETIAWDDNGDECSGLRTCDKDRIQSFINRCGRVPECKMTFHTELLLGGWRPTWWAEAR